MAIVYRNTDLTRWGTGKGARLTSLEGDLNLWQITQRVTELENNPILPVELEAIDVTGNLMTFLNVGLFYTWPHHTATGCV
jgi:hypothetical protein